MAMTSAQRLGIFIALALVMAVTRVHVSLFHHDLWDASWGVFFLAGFWLLGTGRWAFALLMVEAVLVDYAVITRMGLSFWNHYCMSPGYGFLVPAYGALWLGGSWLAKRQRGSWLTTLGMAAAALLVSESACYVISNGSFYWLSAQVPTPKSVAAWVENLDSWYLPFLATTAVYVALGAVLHGLATQLARLSPHRDPT